MPTLPLYTRPDAADASHQVIAPGGYEWWHFDAQSDSGDLTIVARLGLGFLFNPQYARRYERYRRRPTRHPPPVPAEYPCVQYLIFERDRVVARGAAHLGPREVEASPAEPRVRVGRSEFARDGNGSLHLRLGGVDSDVGGTVTAELEFVPLLLRRPFELDSPVPPAGRHRWLIVDPSCEVTGEVRIGGGTNGRELPFRGRGYHDHCYGTQPIGLTARRCRRGRLLLAERVLCHQVAEPIDERQPLTVLVVEASAAGVRTLPVAQPTPSLKPGMDPLIRWPDELQVEVASPVSGASIEQSTFAAQPASAGGEPGRMLHETTGYPAIRSR